MRVRNCRKAMLQQGSLPRETESAGGIAVTGSSPMSIEQLNTTGPLTGPLTGPSHRTFVPIVRNTTREK